MRRKTSKSRRGINRRKAALVCRYEKSNLQKWAEREIDILCGNSTDEDSRYSNACATSALKALISLCGDGHSGYSIKITQNILNRLIDGKPLTPIKDVDEVWNKATDYCPDSDYKTYQCKRCSALFKHVYKDGHVEYGYNNLCYCEDINSGVTYSSGFVSHIIHEMHPITMPFMPTSKPIKVICEDFLTDKKNGDFDTLGIYYAVLEDGKKEEINRWFKETENGWDEISEAEYKERKAVKIND